MGYYVKLHDSTVVIPKENLEEAYECMCRLNTTHHDVKRGGSWDQGKLVEKWFSWMDENYPETCLNFLEIIEALGFNYEGMSNGDIKIVFYDSKTGQEDIFFRSIAHLFKDEESCMFWIGEDGDRWIWLFSGGKMFIVTQKDTKEFMPDFSNNIKSIGND